MKKNEVKIITKEFHLHRLINFNKLISLKFFHFNNNNKIHQ